MQALIDALTQRQTATEVSIGDLRQTITAQAQQADAVKNLLEQIGAQVSQVMASHDRVHKELSDMRDRGGVGGSGRPPSITLKDLRIDVLGDPQGPGFRQQWAEWADKAKDYLSLRLPAEMDLRTTLPKLEAQKDPMTRTQIDEFDFKPASVAELRFFLKNNTKGYPYDQLVGLGDAHPLEMWRVIAQSCDPLFA